jgi:hypothetical protein
MPLPRQRPSEGELRRVSEHLDYELGMMHALSRVQQVSLVKPGSPVSNAILKATQAVPDTDPRVFVEATSNALLEAFLIHFRCVLEFLYPKNRPDDVVASDFFNDPDEWERVRGKKKPTLLKDAEKRANKEVAHLTYKRTMNPADKAWNVSEIARELQVVFDKFRQHADRLDRSWPRQDPADKNKAGPIWVTLPTADFTSATVVATTSLIRAKTAPP